MLAKEGGSKVDDRRSVDLSLTLTDSVVREKRESEVNVKVTTRGWDYEHEGLVKRKGDMDTETWTKEDYRHVSVSDS